MLANGTKGVANGFVINYAIFVVVFCLACSTSAHGFVINSVNIFVVMVARLASAPGFAIA